MRAWWRHISDPSLWPNERLFFELYGQAIQGRAHTVEMLDGIIDDWLEPAAEINMALGLSREEARRPRPPRHRRDPRAAAGPRGDA